MKQQPSWDSLKLFVMVARAGSFSAAADDLGIAQSSLSDHVARFEEKLGYAVLNRTRTGVTLTKRGKTLFTSVSPAVDTLDRAVQQTLHPELGLKPTLRLAGPAEFLSEFVLPALTGRLPGVQLECTFGLTPDLLDDLGSGAVDVVLSSVPVRQPGLHSAPLFEEQFVLVAAAKWRQNSDLETVPILAYAPELPIIRRYWLSVFGHRPRGSAAVIAPDLRTLRTLAVAGHGMTVLPHYLAADPLRLGELVTLHEPANAPTNTLWVITRATRNQHPHLVAGLHALREAASLPEIAPSGAAHPSSITHQGF